MSFMVGEGGLRFGAQRLDGSRLPISVLLRSLGHQRGDSPAGRLPVLQTHDVRLLFSHISLD
jgi:hypothetical protein